MNQFTEELEKRIYNLKKIIKEKEKEVGDRTEGTVQIYQSGNRTQYYLHKDNKVQYIKAEEKEKVRRLCQNSYDQKVLEAAKKELHDLQKIRKKYPEKSCEQIYNTLHKKRQDLVSPIWITDEEYARAWEEEHYKKKEFRDDVPEFYTEKGERVRSKSEILIANALLKYQIPYRYEAPLYLNGYGLIHPDFTLLHVKHRKEIYWEHMGRMDDEVYSEKALGRILAYEKNEIFPGDKLILTHETLRTPLHSALIDRKIRYYLTEE